MMHILVLFPRGQSEIWTLLGLPELQDQARHQHQTPPALSSSIVITSHHHSQLQSQDSLKQS